MDSKTLKRAKELDSLISGIDQNIENYALLKEKKEFAIISTEDRLYKELMDYKEKNKIYFDRKDNQAIIYLSGERKNEVLDLLIKKQEDFINPFKKELEEL